MRKRKKIWLAAVALGLAAVVGYFSTRPSALKTPIYAFAEEHFLDAELQTGEKDLSVDIFQYQADGADMEEITVDNVRTLAWKNAGGSVTFSVNAPEHAKYNVVVTYSLLEDSYGLLERGLTVNGETQYQELSNILLPNYYGSKTYPFEKDIYGNDIIPRQELVVGLHDQILYDRNALYFSPLEIELQKGENTITFHGIKGTMGLCAVKLVPVEETPAYATYIKNQKPNHAKEYKDIIEAENVSFKSGKNIQYINTAELGISPEVVGKKSLNTVGGENYSDAHDFIEWKVTVPEDGYYHLAFKYRQNYNTALTSFRRLIIDGEEPFQEASYVPFPYGNNWELKVPGEEEPYQFYLTKGEHTIRLAVTNAPYRTTYHILHSLSSRLAALELEVREIVGISEDIYRLWDLEEYIPDLTGRLQTFRDDLDLAFDELEKLTGRERTDFNTLSAAYEDLEKIIGDISILTKNADALSNLYTTVSAWETDVMEPSLLLDSVCIKSVDQEFDEIEESPWEKLTFLVASFSQSFAASSMQGAEDGDDNEVVQVWVQRNRDYVDLMQQLANEYYTKETGIKVSVNYCPPGMNLLVLASASGKKPDIVTGVDIAHPFEFAVRDALVDLSQYPGFEELVENIVPGSRIPYQIGDKEYAIAEEVKTNIMYYRKDILDQLDVKLPETWEETTAAASSLLQNQYNFFYPYGDYLTFFFQRGVDIYTEDGRDIAFDNPKGYEAFQYWTDLYLKYGIDPKMTSFYQHFRLGDVPLGITGIDQYMMLEMAAPDISGKWSVAVAPGTINEQGENIRWQAGVQNGLIMFKTNEARQERAWDFVQWWLNEDTQFLYADELENIYGEEFRYFSANTQVVAKQRWDEDVKEVLLEQLSWYRQLPMVPGGSYITSREIWNAWTRTVIDKENYREELDAAIELILPEMISKQTELGYIDKEGNVLKEDRIRSFEKEKR